MQYGLTYFILQYFKAILCYSVYLHILKSPQNHFTNASMWINKHNSPPNKLQSQASQDWTYYNLHRWMFFFTAVIQVSITAGRFSFHLSHKCTPLRACPPAASQRGPLLNRTNQPDGNLSPPRNLVILQWCSKGAQSSMRGSWPVGGSDNLCVCVCVLLCVCSTLCVSGWREGHSFEMSKWGSNNVELLIKQRQTVLTRKGN